MGSGKDAGQRIANIIRYGKAYRSGGRYLRPCREEDVSRLEELVRRRGVPDDSPPSSPSGRPSRSEILAITFYQYGGGAQERLTAMLGVGGDVWASTFMRLARVCCAATANASAT